MAKSTYFNIVITGSRKPNRLKLSKSQRKLIRQYIKMVYSTRPNIRFLIGCADGVDKVARRYCRKKGFRYKKYTANWKLGKHAGHVRNNDMVKKSYEGLAFWDGKTPGTRDCIARLKSRKRLVHIVRLDYV